MKTRGIDTKIAESIQMNPQKSSQTKLENTKLLHQTSIATSPSCCQEPTILENSQEPIPSQY
jgi:hypothetical protein